MKEHINVPCPFKIFWIGEGSERFVAESLEQIKQNLDKLGDYEGDLAEGEYGEIAPENIIQIRVSEDSDETYEGPIYAFVAKRMAEGENLPFQITTSYW
jgi:hypothetical protein